MTVMTSPTTGAKPLRWIGGESPFGLALPDASPTPSTMYAPRGVCLTEDALIVADTGNHRILIWHDPVPDDHADADVVLGQPDMTSEGPGLFFLPTGLAVIDGRLVVADAWHHRILVFDDVPTRSGATPSVVLGQDPAVGLDGVDEGCGPARLYWPFGIGVVGETFFVTDTGNRRVLGWSGGLPEPGQPADLLLGQPDFEARGENRDGPTRADSLRWPHAITSVSGSDGDVVLVADAGNHRVLGWRGDLDERPADVVIGQPDFEVAFESPYRPQDATTYRFPYAIASTPSGALFVADTSNNRVGVIDAAAERFVEQPMGAGFDRVLGQPDLSSNGENRWDRVEADSLCWPYGLSSCGDRLAVADSGNNRVVLWEVDP